MYLESIQIDDKRVNLYYEDGVAFVRNAKDASYDLIIVDSTDPIGPGEGLFSVDFYKDCYRVLGEDGILVNQNESPYFDFNAKEMKRANNKIKNLIEMINPKFLVYEFITTSLEELSDFIKTQNKVLGL